MKMLSNVPPPEDSRELSKHFSDTYFALRSGLALLAFAMPIVLYFYGKLRHGLDLQPSMSAYFWAANEGQCAIFPMRTWFVGFLFAIGIGLYAYKGFTPLENVLLNVAAICAALVAIYPEQIKFTEAADDPRLALLFQNCSAVGEWAKTDQLFVHLIAAITLFVFLASVAWFCAYKSLKYLPDGYDSEKFKWVYRGIAIAMILFPLSGLIVAFLFQTPSSKIFFIEAAGVWTFGLYWAVKSYELSLSRLEKDPVEALKNITQRVTNLKNTSR